MRKKFLIENSLYQKRLFPLAIVLSVVMSIITNIPITANAATNGKCGDNLTWKISDRTLIIEGSGAMYNYDYSSKTEDIDVPPWSSQRAAIDFLSISDDVTHIGDYAFYGFPNIYKPTLPSKLGTIGRYAFRECPELYQVKFGDNLTEIHEGAFYKCPDLNNVFLPESLTSLGSHAFSNCTSLSKLQLKSGLLTIGQKAFYYCTKLISLSIPETVKSIGMQAFCSCISLESIDFGNAAVAIGVQSFYGCTKLESVTIPASVHSIGEAAFAACLNLKEINVDPENANYASVNGSLFNKDVTILYQYAIANKAGVYIIPDTVTTISALAFAYSTFKSFDLGENITTIEQDIFYGCNLEKIYYNGTEEQFNSINIASKNAELYETEIVYFYWLEILDLYDNSIKIKVNANSVLDLDNLPVENVYADKECSMEFNLNLPIQENITLYSKCISQYTYKFVDEDGTIVKEETVDYGTIITPPAEEPTKASTEHYTYTFIGWEGYEEGIAQKAETMVFTAKYNPVVNQYTYKFIDDDGRILKEETVDYGTKITAPYLEDSKKREALDRWQGYTEGMTLTEDIVFIAVYKKYQITVNDYGYLMEVQYNKSFEIEPQQKEGYCFLGYYTAENGEGTRITDVEGNSLVNYIFTGNITVYPYFRHELLNKIKLIGDAVADVGNNNVIQTVTFATDKETKYLSCIVKFPEILTLSKITPRDFVYAEKESEVTKDGYTYVLITGQYANSGNIPLNEGVTPFELSFEISKAAVPHGAVIEIADAYLFSGSDDYNFDECIGNSVMIKPKLAESITIVGNNSIDKESAYTASVFPDYTTDKTVIWSVNNENIATVSQDGVLTPVKNGTVVLTATAADGSGVMATKAIKVTAYAQIENITTDVGVWDKEFSPDKREYTVCVSEDIATIDVMSVAGEGILKVNGSLAFSSRTKTITLDGDKTVLTILLSDVSDCVDGEYTINVVKENGILAYLSEDGTHVTAMGANLEEGNVVILALYKNSVAVDVKTETYHSNSVEFDIDTAYDFAKVMVWKDIKSMIPIYPAKEL